MGETILIFSDGTGQAGGLRPDSGWSNVYKRYQATRTGADSPIDPAKQIALDAAIRTESSNDIL